MPQSAPPSPGALSSGGTAVRYGAAMAHGLRAAIVIGALAVVALPMAGCGGRGPNVTVKTLPSGREIKLLSMGRVYFAKDSPALILNYRTDIPIDDVPKLEQEVTDIWSVFQVDADKSQLTSAFISAHETPKPIGLSFVTTDRSYNFGYRKSADGRWSPMPKQERTAAVPPTQAP
jgi:hypothetical protein